MRVCRRSARTRPATAITSTGPSPAHSFPLNEKSAHESCSKPSQPSRASRCTREASLHACCGWTRTNGLVARKARIASPTEIAEPPPPPPRGHDQRHEQEDGGILRARCQTGGDARPLESAGDGERERHRDQRGHRHVRDRGVRVRDADRLDRDDGRRDEAGGRSVGGAPQPPGGRDAADAEGRDHEPGGQVRRAVLPRLEGGEDVEKQRGVVEPVRVEPAAVDDLPRPRDDVLLVGVEQIAERQAVLDPDQPQGRRERQDRGEERKRPSDANPHHSAPAQRARRRGRALGFPQSPRRKAARRRRGGRPRPSR